MSHTAIEKRSVIARGALDENDYLSSLVAQAARQGLVAPDFPERLQADLYGLLARRCQIYTQGRSNSVRREVAEELTRSILFVLSAHLKRLGTPDEALDQLAREPIERLFAAGLSRVRRMTQSTRLFYLAMRAKCLDTENAFYRDTLFGGIEGFFKLYRPDFFAHEIHITADYPVCFYPQGAQGIEFIRKYLSAWRCEDDFCNRFDRAFVRRAAALCAIHYGGTVAELSLNLYMAALGAALSGEGARKAQDLPGALESLNRRLSLHGDTLDYARETVQKRPLEIVRVMREIRPDCT